MIGMRRTFAVGLVILWTSAAAAAPDSYFPPPEERGGWRSLLPPSGEPDAAQKARIREVAGVDWDSLKAAWDHNADAPGRTGLLVIRRGWVVGEWYRDADRTTPFTIFSSSKSYSSLAFGLILSDFGNGPLPDGRSLALDTKVCNADWLPESLPLPDPRKADITVRHLLTMTSGLGEKDLPRDDHPFEWAFGHVAGSPMAKLRNPPGAAFHYSNAGVAHLAPLFRRATGEDIDPYLRRRVFGPIGETQILWETLGGPATGEGAIGPFTMAYSRIHASARQHARFCYLALHRGEWAGMKIVPASYYDFAWSPIAVKRDYGGLWWTAHPEPGIPRDLARTMGRAQNNGYVIPSLDLVIVRVGTGERYPKGWEPDLVRKVVAAIR